MKFLKMYPNLSDRIRSVVQFSDMYRKVFYDYES